MAESYDSAKRKNDVYYRTLKACFAAAVPLAARGRVLEIGCGTGQVLASLRASEGVGIDLSPRMIEVAKRLFANRTELTFASMDAAAAAGLGEFDAVISADVMEHVQDWHAAVDAMVRACRRGGVIAISTPNPIWTFPLWVLEKVKLKMPEGPHQFVSRQAIASHMRRLGCEVQRTSTHLTIPLELAGIGPRFSSWCEAFPLLRSLGVIQMIVATRL